MDLSVTPVANRLDLRDFDPPLRDPLGFLPIWFNAPPEHDT
jgi:hypothetical protein